MNPAGKLIFKDAGTGQVTVFHYHTFYEMVIACIVRYTGRSMEEARAITDRSFIVQQPPTDVLAAALLTHEYEYHWAMVLVYGEEYWNKYPSISSTPPDDYFDWYDDYIATHQLAAELLVDE